MYIAPGQGQTNPWGQNFDVNRKALSFWPFVASFKRITLKSDFIHIFLMFSYMYIAPGQEQTTLGDKVLMPTESPVHFDHMLQVSKWSLWILILYTFFYYFIHVYSPGPRADKSLGSIFWCQQKALTTSTICCKFQNNLWILILYTFFNVFPHVYSPGAGADNPLMTKFWCQPHGVRIFILT